MGADVSPPQFIRGREIGGTCRVDRTKCRQYPTTAQLPEWPRSYSMRWVLVSLRRNDRRGRPTALPGETADAATDVFRAHVLTLKRKSRVKGRC
eukprot:2225454-Prymnesium_polylepis.1